MSSWTSANVTGKSLRARRNGRTNLRGFALVAVLALLALLVVKLEFKSPDSNDAFYAYGVLVTAVITVTMTVAFAFYQDPAVVARRQNPELDHLTKFSAAAPLVSCIVAVHNEEEIVRRCVLSIIGQTYPKTEVIIIDDASTDGTIGILRELAQKYDIKVIELKKNLGKKGALSEGVLHSRGLIMAFADSDTVWAHNAVEMAVPIFLANPDVGAVSGHCRALNANSSLLTRIQDTWYEGQYSVRKAFESVFGAVTCVSGPLAFFRLTAIYNFMPAWAADTFLGQEFRFATDRTLTAFVLGGKSLGPKVLPKFKNSPFAFPECSLHDWKILYTKSARAWTNVPTTFKAMIRQQVRWKKSFIRNIFVTGAFYWRRPFFTALFYYIHVLFVLCGPFIAARHLIYLPLRGDPMSLVLYLAGIATIGLSFGLAFRYEDPGTHRWMYRPLMSLMSTIIFSWLIFYSAATIRNMTWHRG